MSNLVVDASVSAVWIIEDENHPVADLALEAVYDNNPRGRLRQQCNRPTAMAL